MPDAQRPLFTPRRAPPVAPRTKRLAIYLSGPISNTEASTALAWRAAFRDRWGDTFDVHVPQDRDAHFKHQVDGPARWLEIADGERLDILNSDATIAYVPSVSMGTAMGIMYAYLSGRTVVVVNKLPAGVRLSRMVGAHAHHVCSSLEAAVDFIRARHARHTLTYVVRRDGDPVRWDPSEIKRAIQDSIDAAKHGGSLREDVTPDAGKLAEAVAMRIEDLLEQGTLEPHNCSLELVGSVVEKTLMDNGYHDELSTLATTYIERRERKRARMETSERTADFDALMRDHLHNLKSPVGNLRRACRDLVSCVSDIPEGPARVEVEEFIDEARANLARINKEILEARTKGETRFSYDTVALQAFVKKELKAYLERVDLHVDIPPELCVQTVPHCLRTVLAVILDNAIKHGFQGGYGTVKIRARRKPDLQDVVLDVWNDGQGVTARVTRSMFHQGLKSEGQDWRHGLSQVRRYVGEMGGAIRCTPLSEESEVDGELVLVGGEFGPPWFRMEFDDVARPPSDTARWILLVDDVPGDVQRLGRWFKRSGYEISFAHSIDDAIAALKTRTFHGAVLDYDFKEERNGIWFAKHLTEHAPETRFVMCSGASSTRGQDWREQGLALGALRIFDKETYASDEVVKQFDL